MDMKDHWVSVDYTCLNVTKYSIFIGAFELSFFLGVSNLHSTIVTGPAEAGLTVCFICL